MFIPLPYKVGTSVAMYYGRPQLVWYERATKNFGTNETLLVKGLPINTLELGDQTPGFCVFWLLFLFSCAISSIVSNMHLYVFRSLTVNESRLV